MRVARTQAVEEGNERYFDWEEELEYEAAYEVTNGDVTQAFAIAEKELCHGRRQIATCMDNAVDHIEAKLDGDRRYLRTVEALADALSKRFRLDDDEAVAVMCAAWGAE